MYEVFFRRQIPGFFPREKTRNLPFFYNSKLLHLWVESKQAYDVLNNLTIDAKLSTYNDNEHNLSLEHTVVFEKGDLALYDRNYASFWLFALLLDKQVNFCARVKVGSWEVAKELSDSGTKEIITEIYPSKASAKKCRTLGLVSHPLLSFVLFV